MPASLTDFERALLDAIWITSASLAVVSTIVLFSLSLRRFLRDQYQKSLDARKREFGDVISAIVSQKIAVTKDILPKLRNRDIAPITDVLLGYLRNITGPDSDRLVEVIYAWKVEALYQRQGKTLHRGARIEMLTVLSYLNTSSSLALITDALDSPDLYVQLTAIRCLARRKAMNLLPDIIEAVNHNGQLNKTLLADVLLRFGPKAAPYLERLVASAVNETIRAAAIEALVHLSPTSTAIDFDLYMKSPDEKTRAAAVTLASVVSQDETGDPIAKGIKDPSALVRANVATAIGKAGRVDLIEALTDLIKDPVWWVRYRAGEALMDMNAEGRALMRSFSKQNNLQGVIAREILAEREYG